MKQEDPVLVVDALSKTFSGYQALSDVSFEVRRGRVHSLIGPNGAGKTTLLNVVSGLLAPTHGRVLFNRRDITRAKPYQLARRGLTRTFQMTRLSSALQCWEEVALAAQNRTPYAAIRDLWRLPLGTSSTERTIKRLSLIHI